MKSALVHVMVKHPDREEHVKVSKVKIIRSEKVTLVSLWANLDEDGLISKSSAVADLLNFLQIESIEGLVGKEVEAVEQSKEDKYLCIKAY